MSISGRHLGWCHFRPPSWMLLIFAAILNKLLLLSAILNYSFGHCLSGFWMSSLFVNIISVELILCDFFRWGESLMGIGLWNIFPYFWNNYWSGWSVVSWYYMVAEPTVEPNVKPAWAEGRLPSQQPYFTDPWRYSGELSDLFTLCHL